MIINICNEKGGSGKSTIAINLASRFAIDNYKTLLIDTDSQRSIEAFTNIRASNNLESKFATATKLGTSLISEIKLFESQYELIVIDTGGRDSIETRQAITISNIVIVPCVASQIDVVVLEKMLNILIEAKLSVNPNLKVFFVLSRGATNMRLAQKNNNLKDFLAERLIKNESIKDFILLDSVIYEREAYRNAFIEGLSICEFCKKKDKAYLEFENFYKELTKKI